MDGAFEVVHATAIAVDGRAALIRGPSAAGKSDLALRCLALGRSALIPGSALLVSDDQVQLESIGGRVSASAPGPIRGKLEVRGLGIVSVPTMPAAEITLVVDLVGGKDVERMPSAGLTTNLLGVEIRLMTLAPFEASAPVKLMIYLSEFSADSAPAR